MPDSARENAGEGKRRGEPDDATTFSFLAMAYFRLGEEPAARESYDRALRWMEEPELSEAEREEVTRFRAEAEQVLGIERDDEE